jgi:hypothetical protein
MSAPNAPANAPAANAKGGGYTMYIVGFIILVIVIAAAYYFSQSGGGASSTPSAAVTSSAPPPPMAPAAAPTMAPMTVVNTAGLAPLWSSGQKIQDADLEIGMTSIPFASAPFGYDLTKPPAYSMTMDIMVSQTGDRWRNIMEHGPATGNDFPPGATFRRPSVFITGNDTAPANRLMITHANASGENTNITTTSLAPMGKYFTLSWIVYNGTMTVYINGVADPAGPVSTSFNWPAVDTPWTWNQGNYLGNIAGSIKVKNVYWFNRALATSDMALIASAYGTTTSHYEPEPYTQE